MKAVTVHQFGPHMDARIEDRPEPEPGAGQVLVSLRACDVNHADLLLVEGAYQKKPAPPFVPGMAGAGRVVAVGNGVENPKVGDRVQVLTDYGTFAERVAVPATHCLPLSDSMDMEEAAALGLAYQTAWFALVERGRFIPGDHVLVLGASGGVGMAALQLAKGLGAGRVFASTRGAAGMAFARGMGADFAVDSSRDDFRDALAAIVRSETGGRGADIVVDPVGGSHSTAALRALAWNGRHVVVGFASGEIPSFNGAYLLVKQISVLGLQWTDYRDRQRGKVLSAMADIERLWAAGFARPEVTRRLPLSHFAQAMDMLKTRQSRGKMILTMEDKG